MLKRYGLLCGLLKCLYIHTYVFLFIQQDEKENEDRLVKAHLYIK
jgi:hypothetical protein